MLLSRKFVYWGFYFRLKLHFVFLCVYAYTGAHACVKVGGQFTGVGFFSTMCVSGIESKSLGLEASTVTCGDVSVARIFVIFTLLMLALELAV